MQTSYTYNSACSWYLHLEEMQMAFRVILSSYFHLDCLLLLFTPISKVLQNSVPVLISLQCCWRHRAEYLSVIGSHDS